MGLLRRIFSGGILTKINPIVSYQKFSSIIWGRWLCAGEGIKGRVWGKGWARGRGGRRENQNEKSVVLAQCFKYSCNDSARECTWVTSYNYHNSLKEFLSGPSNHQRHLDLCVGGAYKSNSPLPRKKQHQFWHHKWSIYQQWKKINEDLVLINEKEI